MKLWLLRRVPGRLRQRIEGRSRLDHGILANNFVAGSCGKSLKLKSGFVPTKKTLSLKISGHGTLQNRSGGPVINANVFATAARPMNPHAPTGELLQKAQRCAWNTM